MTRILSLLCLTLGLSVAAPGAAHAGAGEWGQRLDFVAETSLPNFSGGGTLALCHLVNFAEVAFIPVYTNIDSYVLSAHGCEGTTYREFPPELMAEARAMGLIPADVPETPRLTPQQMVFGHAMLIFAAMGALFQLLAWLIHDRKPRGKRGKRGASDALAINALAAMGHVAVSDGHIDESEITQIAAILTRLTGRGFDRDRVRLLLQQLQMHGADVNEIGRDLTDKERQIVMEAALHVAVADGQIHPNEYQLVSQIATQLRIGGQEFREALARISATMQSGPRTA